MGGDPPRRAWGERPPPTRSQRFRAFACSVVALTAVSLGVAILIVMSLNTTGYCWDEARFLPEDEQISSILMYEFESPQEIDPNCCYMSRPFVSPRDFLFDYLPLGRASGFVEGFVAIDPRYLPEGLFPASAYELLEHGHEPDPHEIVLVPVSPCGRRVSYL